MKDVFDKAVRHSMRKVRVRKANAVLLPHGLPEGLGEDLSVELEAEEVGLDVRTFVLEEKDLRAVSRLLLMEDSSDRVAFSAPGETKVEYVDGILSKKKRAPAEQPKKTKKKQGRKKMREIKPRIVSTPDLVTMPKKKETERKKTKTPRLQPLAGPKKRPAQSTTALAPDVARPTTAPEATATPAAPEPTAAPPTTAPEAAPEPAAAPPTTAPEAAAPAAPTPAAAPPTTASKTADTATPEPAAAPTVPEAPAPTRPQTTRKTHTPAKTHEPLAVRTDERRGVRILAVQPRPDEEEWVDVPNMPGLQVTARGQVRCFFDPRDPSSFRSEPMTPDVHEAPNGRPVFSLYYEHKGRLEPVYVSRLVALAFHPELAERGPKSWQVRYRDKNPRNCQLDNIRVFVSDG